MAANASEPKRFTIKMQAADWARKKLEAEAAEREGEDPSGMKQMSLRMPVEDVAFLDAIAHRMKVSRNQAICILVASGCGDVYEALPFADRKQIVQAIEASLGHPVSPYWLRGESKSPEQAGNEQWRRDEEEERNRSHV